MKKYIILLGNRKSPRFDLRTITGAIFSTYFNEGDDWGRSSMVYGNKRDALKSASILRDEYPESRFPVIVVSVDVELVKPAAKKKK